MSEPNWKEWERFVPPDEPSMNDRISGEMSEWERYVPPEEKENLLTALGLAPFRIGSDVLSSAYNLVQKSPEYFHQAKTEIPGLLQTLKEHPGHAGMQALAGSQEAINRLAQMPKGLAEYGENRLNLVPHGVTEFISRTAPQDTSAAISQLFEEPKYPGEKMLRGLIAHAPELTVAGKTAGFAKGLTNKSIVKDVLGTKEKMLEKYSGEKGLYNKLFEKAEKKGARPEVNVDPNKIDFDAIGKKRIERNYAGIDDVMKGNAKSLDNYQSAIKELGIIEREIDKKKTKQGTLTDKEDARLHAAKKAKNYIQKNMFKNEQGKLLSKYLKEHQRVQTGYAKEVIPYTTNTKIEAFEKNKLTVPELIEALKKSPFRAQRGQHHMLETRRKLKNAAIAAGIIGGGGAAYEHGSPLIRALMKQNNE